MLLPNSKQNRMFFLNRRWKHKESYPATTDLLFLTRGEFKKKKRLPDAKLLLLRSKNIQEQEGKNTENSKDTGLVLFSKAREKHIKSQGNKEVNILSFC